MQILKLVIQIRESYSGGAQWWSKVSQRHNGERSNTIRGALVARTHFSLERTFVRTAQAI